ncbi:MAG: hypothetical protein AB7O97_12730 [Planctomycetota bacterium]
MQRLNEQYPLRRGAHERRDDGMCAMEMVAWLAGEEHSDEPQCACPVIAAYVRTLNDFLPNDAARDRLLRPLVPKFVNTREPQAARRTAAELRRGFLVVDACVRRFVPHLLDKRDKAAEAAALRALPEVRDAGAARTALRAVDHWARDLHSARWVLQRAIEGMPPARYVAGALQLVRRAGDAAAWAMAAEVAEALTTAPRVERAPGGVESGVEFDAAD